MIWAAVAWYVLAWGVVRWQRPVGSPFDRFMYWVLSPIILTGQVLLLVMIVTIELAGKGLSRLARGMFP